MPEQAPLAQPPDKAHTGGSPATFWQSLGAGAYLAVLTIVCLYLLFAFWPHPRPNLSVAVPGPGQTTTTPATTTPAAVTPATNTPAESSRTSAKGGAAQPQKQVTVSPAAPAAPRDTTTSGATTSGANKPAPPPGASGSAAARAALAAGDTALASCFVRAASLARDTLPDPQCVTVLGSALLVWDEQRILLLVILAGALGALLHALRSLIVFVGDRYLKRSWLVQYYLQPLTGALIALVMYTVIRGGFFSSGASVQQTSPMGFIALAIVAGLFTGQAMQKLQQIADSVFAPVALGDPRPGTKAPAITSVKPDPATGALTALTLTGTGFTSATTVQVNGVVRAVTARTDTTLTIAVTDADRQVLATGGSLTLLAVNSANAGGQSAPVQFHT